MFQIENFNLFEDCQTRVRSFPLILKSATKYAFQVRNERGISKSKKSFIDNNN